MKKIIAVIIVACGALLMSGCGDSDRTPTQSGTITANEAGVVLFKYSIVGNSNVPKTCAFTTNLPAPNNSFELTVAAGESTANKEIQGLVAGQKVEWTAKVEGNPVNIGSDNFVHIINE